MATYMQRRIAESVRTTTRGWPTPTGDVFAATLYRQTWQHAETGAKTEFVVLCFDEQQEDAGLHRLAAMPGAERDYPHMRLLSSRPALALDEVEAARAVLAVESDAEREQRWAEWRRREDGPSEPDYDAPTVAERNDRAHWAHREGRRG